MLRRITTTLTVAAISPPALLMLSPVAAASPTTSDVLPTAVAPTDVSLQLDMQAVGNVVRDPKSGISLKLQGSWSSLAGRVSFGGGGRSGVGLANDAGKLSPKSGDFAVVAAFSTASVPVTGGYSPNVFQNGFFGQGGQWKIQLHPSKKWGTLAECRVEGDKASVLLRDSTHSRLDDNRAHVVACWRQGTQIGLTVDGRSTKVKQAVGSINPRSGVTVANNRTTQGAGDQLDGSISCVVAAIGRDSLDRALSRSGC